MERLKRSVLPQDARKERVTMAEIEVTRETEATRTQAETAQLNNDMKANYLTPLWQIEEEFMSVRPRPKIMPWLWKWSNLYSLAERAGRLVPVERGGDRRALGLSNPGLGGLPFATSTLCAAGQCLNVPELARAHRHTSHAIRCIIH